MAPDITGFDRIRDTGDARRAIARFERFPKLLSWLVLGSAGLPTLSGVIVTQWSNDIADSVRLFASELDSDRLLLRSDSSAESGRSPRGGYVVHLDKMETEVVPLLARGRAVFLLEPASPFDDLYSVSIEPDVDWQEWRFEVVGPGFDASDLKRGDVTPHEQIRGRVDSEGLRIVERLVATDDVFQTTRTIRLAKTARMLGLPPGEAVSELRRRGESLLIDTESYDPISVDVLAATVRDASRLRSELARLGLKHYRVTISASLLRQARRRVFWDVVWPGSKYRIGDE